MSTDKLRDGRRPPFYIIDNAIIDEYATKIGVYGIAVYNLIARHADANGENAFPSLTTITKKLGIGRTKAAETIQLLIDTGLIEKERRTDEAGDASANLYTIVHLGGSTQSVPPSTQPVPQVVLSEYQGSTQRVLYKDTIKKTPNTSADAEVQSPNGDLPKSSPTKRTGKPKQSTAYTNPDTGISTKDIEAAYLEALAAAEPGAIINRGETGRASKQIAEKGYRPADVTTVFWKMKDEKWRGDGHLSLTSVAKQMAAKLNGKVAVKAHQVANGNGPAYSRIKQL
jgi:hypothetical protein